MYGEEVMENNYQLTRIHNYVMGLMSKEEMYQMEKEALDDPFLQDAIDGYKLQKGVDTHQLSILQQRLAHKLETKAYEKKNRFYSWQRLTIGLAAAVLFVVASSLILFKYLNHSKNERNTDVVLMEHEMRISNSIIGNTDAEPVQGWEQFNEELNSEIRDFEGNGQVSLSFDVVDGHPENLKVISSTNQDLSMLLKAFITDKVEWQGHKANIEIKVKN